MKLIKSLTLAGVSIALSVSAIAYEHTIDGVSLNYSGVIHPEQYCEISTDNLSFGEIKESDIQKPLFGAVYVKCFGGGHFDVQMSSTSTDISFLSIDENRINSSVWDYDPSNCRTLLEEIDNKQCVLSSDSNGATKVIPVRFGLKLNDVVSEVTRFEGTLNVMISMRLE